MKFICRKCRSTWDGEYRESCPACLAEFSLARAGYRRPLKALTSPSVAVQRDGDLDKLHEKKALEHQRASTGIVQLDDVFGRNDEGGKYGGQAGIALKGVYVLSGPRGLGKTALIYEILAQFLRDGVRCAFVSAEQEAEMIRAAIIRVGLDEALRDLNVLCTKNFEEMMTRIRAARIDYVFLDSLNKIIDPNDPTKEDTKSRVNIVAKLLDDAWRGDRPRTWVCVSQMSSDLKVAGREELLHDVDAIGILARSGTEITLEFPDKNRYARAGTKRARFRMNDRGKMVPIEPLAPVLEPPRVESGALVPVTTIVAPPVDIAVTLATPLAVEPVVDEFDAPQTPMSDPRFEGLLASSAARRAAKVG